VYWTWLRDAVPGSGGATLWSVTVDPDLTPPFRDPVEIVSDPYFADTPGQSYEVMDNGDVVYKRGPNANLGYYVRVVPGWVEDMKGRVDGAGR
jgi:hypothetical protein